MCDVSDDNLDYLLHDYFAARLDGQVGRASARFREHVEDERNDAAMSARRNRRAAYGWAIGLAGSALAASVAVMAAGPGFWPGQRGTHSSHSPRNEAVAGPVMYTQVVGGTIDEGTYLVNDELPVRKYRRERLEQATWYDAEMNARVQVTVPREDVMYVEMVTY